MGLADLEDCETVVFPVTKIPLGGNPYGEWYCDATDCVVREVTILAKLHGEPMPTTWRCPACLGELKFHNWLAKETLLFTPDT